MGEGRPLTAAAIRVDCQPQAGGWLCRVTVAEADGSSEHTLSVASSDLDRLASAATDVETLVEESFRFLLEREGRQSILRSFALTDISRYFPEYESQIRQRL